MMQLTRRIITPDAHDWFKIVTHRPPHMIKSGGPSEATASGMSAGSPSIALSSIESPNGSIAEEVTPINPAVEAMLGSLHVSIHVMK